VNQLERLVLQELFLLILVHVILEKTVLNARLDTIVHGAMPPVFATTKVTVLLVLSTKLVILLVLLIVLPLQQIVSLATLYKAVYGVLIRELVLTKIPQLVKDNPNVTTVKDISTVTHVWTMIANGAKVHPVPLLIVLLTVRVDLWQQPV